MSDPTVGMSKGAPTGGTGKAGGGLDLRGLLGMLAPMMMGGGGIPGVPSALIGKALGGLGMGDGGQFGGMPQLIMQMLMKKRQAAQGALPGAGSIPGAPAPGMPPTMPGGM